MFGVGILLQRLVVVAFFAALVAGLCWYDENIKLQVLSLKTEALIFFVGSLFGVLLTTVSHGGSTKNPKRRATLEVSLHSVEPSSSQLVTRPLFLGLHLQGRYRAYAETLMKGGRRKSLLSLKGDESSSLISMVRNKVQSLCLEGVVAEDMGMDVIKETYYFGVAVGEEGDGANIIILLANQKTLLHAHNNYDPSSETHGRLAMLAKMYEAVASLCSEEEVPPTVEKVAMIVPRNSSPAFGLASTKSFGASSNLRNSDEKSDSISKLRSSLDDITRKLKMAQEDDLEWSDSDEEKEFEEKPVTGGKEKPNSLLVPKPTAPIAAPTPTAQTNNKSQPKVGKEKGREDAHSDDSEDGFLSSSDEEGAPLELPVKKLEKNPVGSKWKDEEEDYDDLELSDGSGEDDDDDDEENPRPLALKLGNGNGSPLSQPSFTSFASPSKVTPGLRTITLDDFKSASASPSPVKTPPASSVTIKPKPMLFSSKTVPARRVSVKGKTAEFASVRAAATPPPSTEPIKANPSDLVIEIGMIGERGTGKTSLRRRFVHKTFQASPEKDKLKIAQQSVKINSRTITFSIWDQQTQSFVTSACENFTAFFFFFDLTEPQTLYATMGWQKQVQLLAKQAFVSILVGTKYDAFAQLDQETRLSTVAKVRETAHKLKAAGTVLTSSKEDINVSNLFKITLAKVFDLECFVPIVRDPLEAVVEYEPKKNSTEKK